MALQLDEEISERARGMAIALGGRLLAEPSTELFVGRGFASLSGIAYALFVVGDIAADQRHIQASHEMLKRAAQMEDVPTIGMFDGISGLRAAAALMSRGSGRYGRLVDQCDAYVDEQRRGIAFERVTRMTDYDLISGWSGARLAQCVATPGRPRQRDLEFLEWMIQSDDRWCCSHPLRLDEPPENDLGIAHGIAGVLATIALTEPDITDNIASDLHRASTSLRNWRLADLGGYEWPGYSQSPEASRAKWCYGALGVAASLYWVACRLADRSLKTFALLALEEHARKSCPDWELIDLALCHGFLGNALVFASVGLDSQNSLLLDAAGRAVTFAIRKLERENRACWSLTPDGDWFDYPDELNGAAGITLALLTLTGAIDSEWILCHGLKPFPTKSPS